MEKAFWFFGLFAAIGLVSFFAITMSKKEEKKKEETNYPSAAQNVKTEKKIGSELLSLGTGLLNKEIQTA